MSDEFGLWRPLSVDELADIFASAPFRWWISGGIALELFAGRSWRAHEDIDVSICREDALALRNHLYDLETYLAAAGRIRRWDGSPLSADRHENNLWVKAADGPWLVDVAIGEGDASKWIYRRDASVRRPWPEVVLRTTSGVPFLAPEIQLLFKSKGLRDKDQVDAEEVIPLLDEERRTWLSEALAADHPWQGRLRRPESCA